MAALRASLDYQRGDSDFVPIEIARDIASAISGSRLAVLEGCGHFSYIEQPDAVRTNLAEFFETGGELQPPGR